MKLTVAMASKRRRTAKRCEATAFYDGNMTWEKDGSSLEIRTQGQFRMEGRPLTKLWPVALPFILSKWLMIIGGWAWKLVENISI